MSITGILKILFILTLISSLVLMVFFMNEIVLWMNYISFTALAAISLIEALILIYKGNNTWRENYFFPTTLFIHCLSFCILLVSFQQIGIWKNLLIGISVFFLIDFDIALIYIKHFLKPEIKKIFLLNILIPFLVIFFLGLAPMVMRGQDLYETFNKQRDKQTYEQYIEGSRSHNSDQIPPF